jgi:malate/lactate dehydrogenase
MIWREKGALMKITVLGAAGCIGSSTAFNIAVRGLADELVLIDVYRQDAVAQYVMDLTIAATSQNMTVKAGAYDDMAGSDIVIVAVGAPQGVVTSRMQFLTDNLPLIRDIGQKIDGLCPDAIVVTVTNPVDPFNYAMYLLSSHRDRRRFIGYSANDTFRFRLWAAEILGLKPHRVSGMVIGEHGEHQVMLYSTLEADGKPVQAGDDFREQIRERVSGILETMEAFKSKTGRTLGWTCAVGISAICEAVKHDTGDIIPASVVLDGEYGLHNFSLTVPAVIGRDGVRTVKVLDLAEDEEAGLQDCISYLDTHMRKIEEYLKENRDASG